MKHSAMKRAGSKKTKLKKQIQHDKVKLGFD